MDGRQQFAKTLEKRWRGGGFEEAVPSLLKSLEQDVRPKLSSSTYILPYLSEKHQESTRMCNTCTVRSVENATTGTGESQHFPSVGCCCMGLQATGDDRVDILAIMPHLLMYMLRIHPLTPHLLMYMLIGFRGSSDSKNRSWAVTSDDICSVTGPCKQIMRSCNRASTQQREKRDAPNNARARPHRCPSVTHVVIGFQCSKAFAMSPTEYEPSYKKNNGGMLSPSLSLSLARLCVEIHNNQPPNTG